MRARYTPEQKQAAIDLATTVGKAEAARRTGISPGTIGSWLTRAGLANADPEGRAEHIQVAQETWIERRAELGNQMGEVAGAALEAIAERIAVGKISGVRDLSATLAVLVDKAQLLTGAATARSEVATTTTGTPEHSNALDDARRRASGLRAV